MGRRRESGVERRSGTIVEGWDKSRAIGEAGEEDRFKIAGEATRHRRPERTLESTLNQSVS